MKKSILGSLLIPALLVGCSESTTTTTDTIFTYKWQMVHLESVDESALDGSCIIYSDSTVETDESTTADPEYQVITAYKADEDYNIIYHNEDGSIEETFDADETNSGVWYINPDDVPDNGYVTLEEVDSIRGGVSGSYMFSVQKSLLKDMVLNVVNPETGADCVTGQDYREGDEEEIFVNVTQLDDDINFYQSSYDVDSINGKTAPGAIPVDYIEDENRDILITTFATYDTTTPGSEENTDLQQWAFVDSSYFYETNKDANGDDVLDDDNDPEYLGIKNTDAPDESHALSDDNLTDVTWEATDPTDSIVLDGDNNGVIVLHDDTTYLWQPFYDSTDLFTVAYDTDEVETWNSYFSGTLTLADGVTKWSFNSFNTLADEPTEIYLIDVDLSIQDSLANSVAIFNGTSTTTCNDVIDDDGVTTIRPEFCVDLSGTFDADEFTHQRLHIRLKDDDDDNLSYQTIYSKVNDKPVVLESNEVSFADDNFDTVSNFVRIELNLMNTNDEDLDATQYLMSQNIDIVNLGIYGSDDTEDLADTNDYSDLNGYIATETETEDLYQAVLGTNTTVVKSAYEQ